MLQTLENLNVCYIEYYKQAVTRMCCVSEARSRVRYDWNNGGFRLPCECEHKKWRVSWRRINMLTIQLRCPSVLTARRTTIKYKRAEFNAFSRVSLTHLRTPRSERQIMQFGQHADSKIILLDNCHNFYSYMHGFILYFR